MTATVLTGALAVGVPTTDAVLVEHTPVEPGRDACRACGHVYTAEMPTCPAVVVAEAGFPSIADQVRVVPAGGQMSETEQLQIDQERLLARVEVLEAAAASDGERPTSLRELCTDVGGALVMAAMWSLNAVLVVCFLLLPNPHGRSPEFALIVVGAFVAVQALDYWVRAVEQVIEAFRLVRQPPPQSRVAGVVTR